MRTVSNTAYLGRSTASFALSALITGSIAAFANTQWIASSALVLTTLFGSLFALQLINQLAQFLPSPLARIIHWIHAMSIEAFAVVAVTFLHPLRYLEGQKVELAKGKGRPILLIHGYLHDCSGWVYQRRCLKEAGLGPIYMLNLGHPFRSICDYADKIGPYADKIERETARSDLILIGHSMGGLVASWYAIRKAKAGKVTDVITIGSPLGGTAMARIAIGPNGREMRCGSELVQELQQEIANSKQTRFYQIATRTDQLIIPQASALVGSDPKRQFVIEDIGHIGMLFSPRVANQISRWLYPSSFKI